MATTTRRHRHYMAVGDRLPVIGGTMRDRLGAAVDLTGATVRFYLRDPTAAVGTYVIDQPAAFVTDGSDGQVQYLWQVGDTATAGLFYARFVATMVDGREATFPSRGWREVLIGS